MGPCPYGRHGMASTAHEIDVIDLTPRMTEADAAALNARFDGFAAQAMLRALVAEERLGRIAVVSSFGAESAALLHLIASVDKTMPIIFVDTLKMFAETLTYRAELIARLGLTNNRTIEPDASVIAAKDATGLRWSYDPDGCCDIRKVEPLARAKQGLDSWISGRKAFQSATRANLPRFEIEAGRLKINPISDWTKADLDAYFAAHDLPRHPLEAQGYLSVGCEPCTSKVMPGEDPRAGRWRGWEKTECGIHTEPQADDPIF
jgi:phosphoadenosine phosphosulfate reductase